MIFPLAGQDAPGIEARRVGHQVPLADDGRVVAGLVEQAGKRRLLLLVERIEVLDAVSVGVLAGEDRRPAGRADGVGHEAVGEPHALRGDAVDLRGRVDLRAVAADRLGGVVVGHDEEDIGRAGHVRRLGTWAGEESGREGRPQAYDEPYQVVSR